MAELIGTATQYKSGLMPAEYAVYNKGKDDTLDFNSLRIIGRMYCSYNSINGPIGGNYYWGIYNIGWDNGHFVQFACATFDSSFMRVYVRSFCGNSIWTEWKQIA